VLARKFLQIELLSTSRAIDLMFYKYLIFHYYCLAVKINNTQVTLLPYLHTFADLMLRRLKAITEFFNAIVSKIQRTETNK
jgi:hypothetical protein